MTEVTRSCSAFNVLWLWSKFTRVEKNPPVVSQYKFAGLASPNLRICLAVRSTTAVHLMCLCSLATWPWLHELSLCVFAHNYWLLPESFSFYRLPLHIKFVCECCYSLGALCLLQWSWPWSWTVCMVGFATLASTQTLSWNTPRERGGSPSLISRATLLLSVLALYSCSMGKSINGWVKRNESSVFLCLPPQPLFFFYLSHPHLVSRSASLKLSEKCCSMYRMSFLMLRDRLL